MLINSWCSSRYNGYYFSSYMNMIVFCVYSSRLYIDCRSNNTINVIVSTFEMMHYLTFNFLCAIKNLDLLALRRIGFVLMSFYFICLTNFVAWFNQLRQSACSIFYPMLLKDAK